VDDGLVDGDGLELVEGEGDCEGLDDGLELVEGDGEGLGEGLGDGLELGEGDGEGLGDGEGVGSTKIETLATAEFPDESVATALSM
jgi:hypothetical protein